jgi:hypothetical protein
MEMSCGCASASAFVAPFVFNQLNVWWPIWQTGGLDETYVNASGLGWTPLAAAFGFLLVFFWVLRRS